MEKLNMKNDRLKGILDVCNLSELDSIDILLGFVKNYDLKLINSVFKNSYQQKWDKYSDKFEGINEYDYITRINNFDISKTFTMIELNSYELVFFKKIIEDALLTINNNKNPLDLKITSNIDKALTNINDRLNDLGDFSDLRDRNVLDTYDYHDKPDDGPNDESNYEEKYEDYEEYDNYINDLDKLYESKEKITDEELENMFKKFNVTEIEEFDNIFEHIETYNIEKIINTSNKVKNEKSNNIFKKFEVFARPNNYNINSLCHKKDILSEKELKLLCILLKDVILNYEEHDDFYASLSNLMDSYIEELIKRKEISEKPITNQNINEESNNSSKRDLFLESLKVSSEDSVNNKECLNEEQEKKKNNPKETDKDRDD